MTTIASTPPMMARGSVRAGSFTSPEMKVRSAQPSYAHITATSASPKPLQVVGDQSMGPRERPLPRVRAKRNAATASPAMASTLAAVLRFCTAAPQRTERMFASPTRRMAAAATTFTPTAP